MHHNIVNELEVFLETKELKNIGMTEEEISGYFEFYFDSWFGIMSVANEN